MVIIENKRRVRNSTLLPRFLRNNLKVVTLKLVSDIVSSSLADTVKRALHAVQDAFLEDKAA